MFAKRLLPLLVAGALISHVAFAAEPVAAGKKVWITMGDEAFTHLRALQPKAVAKASQFISNGNSGLIKQEKVHLIQVNEDFLPKLAEQLHSKTHRCGGYVFHATEAEGLKSMSTPVAPSLLAAVRPSYVIDNQTTVNSVLPAMLDTNIGQTIVELSTNFPNRYYTTSGGVNASAWLLNKWKTLAAGRSDISVAQFTHPSWAQKSVILTINGTDNANEVVIIGGHLDSINGSGTSETTKAPGADDDASGIASMTEVIRAMVSKGFKPRRTIKFMAYAAEEVGLRGSKEIAANFKANNVNVVGVMQLDMTNFKGAANDIFIFTDYTDSAQNTFVANLIKTYQPNLTIGYDVCNYGCSDHASWTAQGYFASMPFESSFSASNKNIHTVNDTFASMGSQATHSLKFAKLAASFAIELGSDAGVPPPPANITQTFTGSLATSASKTFGPFKVRAGGTMKLSTTGTGNINIYGRKTSVPTTSVYDCRSAGFTSTESCTVNFTANGDGYVLVRASTAGNYTLNVTYSPQ